MTATVNWYLGVAFGVTWLDGILYVMFGPAQIEIDFYTKTADL